MPTNYQYEITSSFPNGKVDPPRLTKEIKASVIVPALLAISTTEGLCIIGFADALSTDEKAVLDGVVAAHSGSRLGRLVFHVSSLVVSKEIEVTETSGWQTCGGAASNVDFFSINVPSTFGRVVGMVKTSGSGAEARVVELRQDGTSAIMATYELPNTNGAWKVFRFSTGAPAGGENSYALEARRNAVEQTFLRFTSLALLEIL